MRILAFDTASPRPALALVDTGAEPPALEMVEPLPGGAAELLVDSLRALQERADVPLRTIHRIGVLCGPGSFTGLRAGAAFARGLARSLGVPLVNVSTFRAASLARSAPEDADLLLDAGRGDVHRARRRGGVLLEGALPLERQGCLDDARRDGVSVLDLSFEPILLALALARLAASDSPGSGDAAPVYGRASAAEEKIARGGPGE